MMTGTLYSCSIDLSIVRRRVSIDCIYFHKGRVVLLVEKNLATVLIGVYPIIYDGFFTSQVVVWDF